MEKDKEEIIADLYALRGGLSVISNYTGKIRKKDENIEYFAAKEKEAERSCIVDENELKETKKELDKLYKEKAPYQDSMEHHKMQALKEQQEAENHIRKSANQRKRMVMTFMILTLISVIASIILLRLSYVLGFSEGGEICGAIGGFLAACSVIFLIVFIVCLVRYIKGKGQDKSTREYIKAYHSISTGDIGYLENCLVNINNSIKEKEKILNKLKDSCVDWKKAIQVYKNAIERCTNEKEEILQNISFMCQNIKQALNATYDSWLSESDWQNVDLIIYYLETGRADTLKESLSMVDRQLQTNQIVSAISMASEAICDKIDSSMRRLGGALEASFKVISRQLSEVSGKMDTMISISEKNAESYKRLQEQHIQAVNSLGDEIKELKSAQLTAEEMNRALLEKANRSSKELIQDLRYGQRYWIK